MSEEIEKPDAAKLESANTTNFYREAVRGGIVLVFLCGFFGTIAAGFFVGLHNGFDIKDYRDMLLAISAVLSGPLGFIIGYCFKSAKD